MTTREEAGSPSGEKDKAPVRFLLQRNRRVWYTIPSQATTRS